MRHYVLLGVLFLVLSGLATWAFKGSMLESTWLAGVPVELRDSTLLTKQSARPKLIATYRDVPPDMLTYSPNRHSGPLRYVVEEAANRIGYDIEWKSAPFSKSLELADVGSIDIIPYSHFKTEEREKKVRFSVSLGRVPTVTSFLQHAGDRRTIKTLGDLNGRTVGYRPGSYYFEEFATDLSFAKVGYSDDQELVKGFVERTVEIIMVNNRQAGERALAAAGYNANNYKYAELTVNREADLYLMYSRVPQRQEIFDRMDQVLAQMRSEGLIADIYESFEADAPKAK